MAATPFPQEFPLDDVQCCVEAIRQKKCDVETAHCLLVTCDFALGQLHKSHQSGGQQQAQDPKTCGVLKACCPPGTPCDPCSPDECCDHLQKACDQHKAQAQNQAAPGTQQAMPPIPWAMILQTLLPLLLQILSGNQGNQPQPA